MDRKYRLIHLIFLSLAMTACSNSPANTTTNTVQSNAKFSLSKTTVDEISEAFAQNKNRFAELCTDKIVFVSGEFVSIEDNKGETIVIIKSAATDATVRVVFKNLNVERFYQIEAGQKVNVQGSCETTADGFFIKGANILLITEKTPKKQENQNTANVNQKSPKK